LRSKDKCFITYTSYVSLKPGNKENGFCEKGYTRKKNFITLRKNYPKMATDKKPKASPAKTDISFQQRIQNFIDEHGGTVSYKKAGQSFVTFIPNRSPKANDKKEKK